MIRVGAVIIVATVCLEASASDRVVTLFAHEFVSVQDVLDRYEALQSIFAEDGDARVVFVAMVRTTTVFAAEALDGGFFEDSAWTTALLLDFNNRYREALLNYELGRRNLVAEAWRVAFDAAKDPQVNVFTHAVLGIHAHIQHDLAYSISAVVPRADRMSRLDDFTATNIFLLSAIDLIEDTIAAFDPSLYLLDEAMGRLDERLLEWGLSQWRFGAWDAAAGLDPSGTGLESRWHALVLEYRTGHEARALRSLLGP